MESPKSPPIFFKDTVGEPRKPESESLGLQQQVDYLREKLRKQHLYFVNRIAVKDEKHLHEIDGYLDRERTLQRKYDDLKEDYRILRERYKHLKESQTTQPVSSYHIPTPPAYPYDPNIYYGYYPPPVVTDPRRNPTKAPK